MSSQRLVNPIGYLGVRERLYVQFLRGRLPKDAVNGIRECGNVRLEQSCAVADGTTKSDGQVTQPGADKVKDTSPSGPLTLRMWPRLLEVAKRGATD